MAYLIDVLVHGTYSGRPWINRYSYWHGTNPVNRMTNATVGAFLQRFGIKVIEEVYSATHVSNLVTYAEVRGLEDYSTIYGTYTFNSAGEVTGNKRQPWQAWGFRLNRSSVELRHGYKRICGVADAMLNSNDELDSGWSGYVTDVSAAILAQIDDDSGGSIFDNFIPVLISRTVNGQPRSIFRYQGISSVTFLGLTTQNTRKG